MPTRRPISGRPTRTCFLALLAVLGAVGFGSGSGYGYEFQGGDQVSQEIKEDFSTRDFDRSRWTLDNTSVALTKVDLSKGVMRLTIPPGPDMRPLMGLIGRFGLEGNFDVRVDYLIRSLPKPDREWVNLSIFVSGPDGMAAISRTNDAGSGHGYSRWFRPTAGVITAPMTTNIPTDDKAGTLRLERVGKELQFHAGGRGGPLHRIGAVEFGDRPIETLSFQVLPQPLKSSIDVEFDNISVQAERIIGQTFKPPSRSRAHIWVLFGSGIAALGFLLWWAARRGR